MTGHADLDAFLERPFTAMIATLLMPFLRNHSTIDSAIRRLSWPMLNT